MFLAAFILIIGTGLLAFYIQATCEMILRREFASPYFRVIVDANRLEFLSLRKTLAESDSAPDYQKLRLALKCDFLALLYLLKHVAKKRPRYSVEERLLVLYSRTIFLSMAIRHLIGLREKPAALKLASIFQYFANVVGQRIALVRVGAMRPEAIPSGQMW